MYLLKITKHTEFQFTFTFYQKCHPNSTRPLKTGVIDTKYRKCVIFSNGKPCSGVRPVIIEESTTLNVTIPDGYRLSVFATAVPEEVEEPEEEVSSKFLWTINPHWS